MDHMPSSPAPPPSIHPSFRLPRHILIEPFEGKVLRVPVFPKEPKWPDHFLGHTLIQYRPHRPENRRYEYQGPTPARKPKERFEALVQSYTLQLLDSIKSTKCERCFSILCDVCAEVAFIRKKYLAVDRKPGNCSNSSQLAHRLHAFLLDGIELYKWSPDLATWVQSRKDIWEMCMLANRAGFGKQRRSWVPVFEAHAILACGGRTARKENNEQWFMDEMREEQGKAVKDLRNGRYEDAFVYALSSDGTQRPVKSVGLK